MNFLAWIPWLFVAPFASGASFNEHESQCKVIRQNFHKACHNRPKFSTHSLDYPLNSVWGEDKSQSWNDFVQSATDFLCCFTLTDDDLTIKQMQQTTVDFQAIQEALKAYQQYLPRPEAALYESIDRESLADDLERLADTLRRLAAHNAVSVYRQVFKMSSQLQVALSGMDSEEDAQLYWSTAQDIVKHSGIVDHHFEFVTFMAAIAQNGVFQDQRKMYLDEFQASRDHALGDQARQSQLFLESVLPTLQNLEEKALNEKRPWYSLKPIFGARQVAVSRLIAESLRIFKVVLAKRVTFSPDTKIDDDPKPVTIKAKAKARTVPKRGPSPKDEQIAALEAEITKLRENLAKGNVDITEVGNLPGIPQDSEDSQDDDTNSDTEKPPRDTPSDLGFIEGPEVVGPLEDSVTIPNSLDEKGNSASNVEKVVAGEGLGELKNASDESGPIASSKEVATMDDLREITAVLDESGTSASNVERLVAGEDLGELKNASEESDLIAPSKDVATMEDLREITNISGESGSAPPTAEELEVRKELGETDNLLNDSDSATSNLEQTVISRDLVGIDTACKDDDSNAKDTVVLKKGRNIITILVVLSLVLLIVLLLGLTWLFYDKLDVIKGPKLNSPAPSVGSNE